MLTPVQMVLNGAKKYHTEFFVVLGDLLSTCAVSIAACPDILPAQLPHSALNPVHCCMQQTTCLFTAACKLVVHNRQGLCSMLSATLSVLCITDNLVDHCCLVLMHACCILSLTSSPSVVHILASPRPAPQGLTCMTQASLQQPVQLHSWSTAPFTCCVHLPK